LACEITNGELEGDRYGKGRYVQADREAKEEAFNEDQRQRNLVAKQCAAIKSKLGNRQVGSLTVNEVTTLNACAKAGYD